MTVPQLEQTTLTQSTFGRSTGFTFNSVPHFSHSFLTPCSHLSVLDSHPTPLHGLPGFVRIDVYRVPEPGVLSTRQRSLRPHCSQGTSLIHLLKSRIHLFERAVDRIRTCVLEVSTASPTRPCGPEAAACLVLTASSEWASCST